MSPALYEDVCSVDFQEEEAEWVGLTLEEAVRKQLKKESEAREAQRRPKKLQHLEELFTEESGE